MKIVKMLCLGGLFLSACGGGAPEVTGYKITGPAAALTVAAGDSLKLDVQATYSDGTTGPLPTDAKVEWGGPAQVKALAPGSMPQTSALPDPGTNKAVLLWLDNATRFTGADLTGVLWALSAADKASNVDVKVTVTSGGKATTATATVSVQPGPAGDVTRGKALYAANCASCHGATGHGTTDYPGINGEKGNPADEWTPALFALSSRAAIDDEGVALKAPMPLWLTQKGASGKLLTTQDFADLYAFLKTQTK